ncbi:MAG TPA: hypothetical protein PKN80_00435 [bacterium]|uniref:Dihydroorotate dehydrogenase 2 n=1 Tax=candidate division TA06 bacterium ADurb.Bin417 TaxID=1852828 RepID=A0A1V5MIT8_UNCT6|nr:MAG: dihydroorotate dehydrogenase 2 [candidate division TA06 bacterium ADurb.Bin417]HNQ34519.1 hypothetical protein [bacterium]HNS48035.1 hypothetical protein [bacterium]
MADGRKRLAELADWYRDRPLDRDLEARVLSELGLSLAARYGGQTLKNPLLVAPGQLTLTLSQVQAIRKAGYAGCVLKSVVGESPDGACSMARQRIKPTSVRTYYEPEDTAGAFPIIHWDGRLDIRGLDEYLDFAGAAAAEDSYGSFSVVASLLCHLPRPGEDFRADEWSHTAGRLGQLGYRHLEIDFCPFLSSDRYTEDQANILRWYRSVPALVKRAGPSLRVFPKLLNLDWGIDYQVQMARAAVEGGADGLVVANRGYRPEFASGHGGPGLRRLNLEQVRRIKREFPGLPVSATGGVYRGRDVLEYLEAGAENVQLLSYLMGRVKAPFRRGTGNRLEKVLYQLIFDPDDGLLAVWLDGPKRAGGMTK